MAQIEVSNLVTGADNVDDYFTTANPPLENRKVTLSAAQVNALSTSEVTLAPAASGEVLIPVLLHLTMNNGSTHYLSGGNLEVIWAGTSTVAIPCGTFTSNVGTTGVVSSIVRPQEGRSSFAIGASLNIKTSATVTNNGNGTFDISLFYYQFDSNDF